MAFLYLVFYFNFKSNYIIQGKRMKITSKTNGADALRMSKNVAEVFKSYKLHCVRCKGIANETIEKIAFNSGLDLNLFLEDLNRVLEK